MQAIVPSVSKFASKELNHVPLGRRLMGILSRCLLTMQIGLNGWNVVLYDSKSMVVEFI